MQFWKKLTQEERKQKIQFALKGNVNFSKDASLGYPASKLDGRVFYDDAPFLKDAPTLQTYVANPNNIGCHTFGTSEKAFYGTQEIEREVLNVIAVDIFKAKENEFDGYIAPGGTEANIQAIWVFRNEFMHKFDAKLDEIAILASEDTHYSIPKASNLLQIDWLKIPVGFENREIDVNALDNIISEAKNKGKKYFIAVSNMGTTMFGSVDNPDDYTSALENIITEAKNKGKKYFIAVSNMATTMFGSVDNPDVYTSALEKHNVTYRLHIDGAYGGFVYPFSNQKSTINFSNPKISSITIDAHKMLQSPYGTGVFICRKGLIENVSSGLEMISIFL